ncbi:MAG: STT3 domain-containing protein [Candidatus Undinarchaeales archaeon]|jgi:dolichyl-diphosphooligosaccharide--protein glycosyltransferase|nr:STT3 domain-containing protein [Candidatus Undinarchaeales archaeon]
MSDVDIDTSYLSGGDIQNKKHKKEKDEVRLNLSAISKWVKQNKKTILYVLLILLLFFSAWIRFIPEKKFTGDLSDGFAAMDPYWHYRHAKNVYEHGYIGDEIRIVDGEEVYWDTMHDAPEGSRAYQEFYPYFSAYSYKYFGSFFAPNLLTWHRWTPVFFALFAVLGMFLLVKHLFGSSAGIFAALLYSISPIFLTRSVSGFADTDALVAFFTIFTFYLFIKAWDKSSYVYGVLGGLCLGLFGITWTAYSFVPVLMFGFAGFYFLYQIARKFRKKSKNIFQLIKDHLETNWKKYVIFAIVIVLGLSIVGFVKGIGHANILSSITASTKLKNVELSEASLEGESVRNVHKTIIELQSLSLRQVIQRIHLAPFLLAAAFFALLPVGLWKKVKKYIPHLVLFSVWLLASIYMSLKATRFVGMLSLPICIFAGTSVAFAVSKIKFKKPVVSVLTIIVLFLLLFALPNLSMSPTSSAGISYYKTGKLIATQANSILGPNWFDFLHWARDSTPKDAIFASWWDPGHAMTAVGERPSVADGSQNDYHVHDLGVALTTTDESLAFERLKKYNTSYFYTSSDLLLKYEAISFLVTGQKVSYPIAALSEIKETASGSLFIYYLSPSSKIILNIDGDHVSAILKEAGRNYELNKILYYIDDQQYLLESSNINSTSNLLYVTPEFDSVLFFPEHLENNMLTQLHFFNGQNLDHFQLVGNFNEEIKVFKFLG